MAEDIHAGRPASWACGDFLSIAKRDLRPTKVQRGTWGCWAIRTQPHFLRPTGYHGRAALLATEYATLETGELSFRTLERMAGKVHASMSVDIHLL